MRLPTASLLALACVANAAVIPRSVRGLNETITAAATGYKNVAYYVNWVQFLSSSHVFMTSPLTQP
jgi:hypothetical protein